MTISWSFPYNSFVKVHAKNIWEPQHECSIQNVKVRCDIKGLHCLMIIYIQTKTLHYEVQLKLALLFVRKICF